MNKDTRGLLAVVFLTAAVFLAMGRIVESAPIGEWGLTVVLAVIGVVLALSTVIDFSRSFGVEDEEETDGKAALPAPKAQTVYEFAGASAPQLRAPAPALASAAAVNGTAQAVEGDDAVIPPIDDDGPSAPIDGADLDLDGVSADEPAPPPLDDDRPVSPDDDTARSL